MLLSYGSINNLKKTKSILVIKLCNRVMLKAQTCNFFNYGSTMLYDGRSEYSLE